MDEEILNIIKEEFYMIPESFGGEISREEIDKSTQLLGIELPEDYIEFVCRFGCDVVGTTVILNPMNRKKRVLGRFVTM